MRVSTFRLIQQTTIDDIFLFFSWKILFDSLSKLSPYDVSPKETVCMKCQILFSRKIRKKYFKMSSAEIFTQHAKR